MRHPHHAPGACRSSGRPRLTDLPGRSPAGGNDSDRLRCWNLPTYPEQETHQAALLAHGATNLSGAHTCLATGRSQDLSPVPPQQGLCFPA